MKSYAGLISTEENRQENILDGRMSYVGRTVTMKYDRMVYRLFTAVDICECGKSDAQTYRVNAIWDTGASSSAISRSFAEKMGLPVVERGIGITASGEMEINYSFVNIYLAPEIAVKNLKVSRFPLPQHNADFLIGMDVISRGNFSIQNSKDQTTITFSLNL